MSLPIHQDILQKLDYFHQHKKIPHLLFHGASGSGKRTLLNHFIDKIYDHDKEKLNNYVMQVNCAYGKGIKFIREELKFFAKTHIFSNGGDIFKSIILLNADKLTIDAQSALRRCIELFSHNTRFFILVEDKHKLLKPILSRFCELYVPEPVYKNKILHLHKWNLERIFASKEIQTRRMEWLKKELQKVTCPPWKTDVSAMVNFSSHLYEKGYAGIDIIHLLEKNAVPETNLTEEKRYELLFVFHRVRRDLRNEKLLLFFLLHFLFVSSNVNLENISFM